MLAGNIWNGLYCGGCWLGWSGRGLLSLLGTVCGYFCQRGPLTLLGWALGLNACMEGPLP